MMQHAAHQRAARRRASAVAVDVSDSTSTGRVASVAPRELSKSSADAMFAGVAQSVRMQLELIVRHAVDQDAALEVVVARLCGPTPAKCTAIVEAFRTNPALQQQWQGAWRELRS